MEHRELEIADDTKAAIASAFRSGSFVTVGYVGDDGWPRLSRRGTVQVFGSQTLALWARKGDEGLAEAIVARPKLTLFYLDLRRGNCRQSMAEGSPRTTQVSRTRCTPRRRNVSRHRPSNGGRPSDHRARADRGMRQTQPCYGTRPELALTRQRGDNMTMLAPSNLLVDPTTERPRGPTRRMVDRPSTLDGTVLGIREFWAGFDRYTAAFEQLLRAQFDLREVNRADGMQPRSGSVLARWQQFTREVDVAIVGLGGCGGCAPWAAMDSCELEARGVATVTLVTPELLGVAERTAQAKGYDLRFVLLPQTLDDLDERGMAELVRSTYSEIVGDLTRPLV